MRSRATRRFWRLFGALPPETQREASRAYRLFRDNPAHPGLQFKKLEGSDDVYSVRITLDCRALGVMRAEHIVWYWIGGHAEYDRLI